MGPVKFSWVHRGLRSTDRGVGRGRSAAQRDDEGGVGPGFYPAADAKRCAEGT